VIVAGIQSVYKRACELGAFDLIVIDEAHLIAPEGEGMYRTFLDDAKVVNPHIRIIGLTATPYRMKGGVICQPENILNHVCYEAGLKEMIHQGYLSKLISRSGRTEAKLDNLHVRGGEFIASEVEDAMDNDELVNSACREIAELTSERKSVLIFTSGVEHCKHVAKKIEEFSGKECGIVTGTTSAVERAELLARFRGEKVADDFFSSKPALKFLANVNVLTTGFDAANVDCVVLLRPTNSAGLLVQMIGRGTRLHPGKENCLVLDYGGNILRHGPVDMIQVKNKTPGSGEAPAKKCPECLALIHAAYQKCPECGYDFPPPAKNNLESRASGAGILSGQYSDEEFRVHKISYSPHFKRGAPPDHPMTLRIDYQIGYYQEESEWVCPEHSGYARNKFEKWWRERSYMPPPITVAEAVNLAKAGALAEPESITLRETAGEKFKRIVKYQLKPKPDFYPEPGLDIYEPPPEIMDVDYEDEIPF
jgi:DNA repair protein RadD